MVDMFNANPCGVWRLSGIPRFRVFAIPNHARANNLGGYDFARFQRPANQRSRLGLLAVRDTTLFSIHG